MLTLLYHNVLPGQVNLPVAEGQVTLETFAEHMFRFRKLLLHPIEVHDQLHRGKMPDGILVTFDDGAAGIVKAGRILADLGTAGVAFVCPGALKSGLWFYRLADGLGRATVSRLTLRGYDLPLATAMDRFSAYRLISTELFDKPAPHRDELLGDILEAAGLPAGEPAPALTTLDELGLRIAADTGGLIFANHSWSHPNLVKLSTNQLVHEIEDADSWLRSSKLPFLPWFAFPRGIYDARVRAAVAKYCHVAFGASAREAVAQVLPRTYLCQADANRVRFAAKTAFKGGLRRYLLWR